MCITRTNGFTIVETLISLTIIIMILSISFPLFQLIDGRSYYEELSARQLFTFVQNEINQSSRIWTIEDTLYMLDGSNRTITVEKAGSIIRRQVDGQGHEPLLQDVAELTIIDSKAGFSITVRMSSNETFQKELYVPLN